MDNSSLEELRDSFLERFRSIKNLENLEALRVDFLGKKSHLSRFLASIAEMSEDKKRVFGAKLHQLREDIRHNLQQKGEELRLALEKQKLAKESLDVTLEIPDRFPSVLHPLSKIIRRIHQIFLSLGFQTVFGPEVETPYYNFDALNIPENHPARDLADTFFLPHNRILRTQTSGVQIRYMEKCKPPISIISPGRCFRKDEIDATHLPLFHQVEGLVVDKKVSFAALKGTLEFFAQSLFGPQTKIRFRPDFFPFVEPGAEVALSCPVCLQKSSQCAVCKGSGYVEVAGCGLVHPKVLSNCGIDSKEYSGYAFGFGIERLAMIYYGIPDIRLFYENHPDFLSQFSNPLF